MKGIILLMLVLNITSCMVLKMIHGGRLLISEDFFNSDQYNQPVVYLIAGMKNQATTAYSLIDFPGRCVIPLNYSLLGYNPIVVGEQIDVICNQADAVVIGTSIGAKAVVYSGIDHNKRVILVNPCIYPDTMKINIVAGKAASVLLEAISVLIGWFSIIPLPIGDMGNSYSIALLADQFFWSMWGNPRYDNGNNISIVISEEDEFLDNIEILRHFRVSRYRKILTRHGRTGNVNVAGLYQEAINTLLQ